MRALVVIENRHSPLKETSDGHRPSESAADALIRSGYLVTAVSTCERAPLLLPKADACVVAEPASVLPELRERLNAQHPLPLFWWCSERTANLPTSAFPDSLDVDGILFSRMSPAELEWSLYFGERQFRTRRQWFKEREQLLARLEERKWIERAKGILSRMRNVSEAEAYDMLRKQAMNERKRIAEVAASVVHAYQLLHE